ncbi:MAG: hypothetical protein FVQ84_09740 [Planctomycetes bacterium]|nr:hypothetical protein [Planctomycetota bacterium]
MPILLHGTKFNKWLNRPDWLREGEIPADPIFGFRIGSNTMSVWIVDDDSSRIKWLAVALSIKKNKLEDFEFVLLDSTIVDDIGIKATQTVGRCPDSELNQFHLDLVEISAQRLLQLTQIILKKISEEQKVLVDRIPRKDVAQYIQEGISKGRINSEDVKIKVLEQVKELVG